MIPLTVCAPAALRQTADALGIQLGTASGGTVEEWVGAFNPTRQDANGGIWHVMSMSVSQAFIEAHISDVAAMPGLLIWTPGEDAGPVPTALDNPAAIIAVIGLSGLEAVAAVGLSVIDSDE